MSEFDGTPSFYNDAETFEKYLGQTSYYLKLQDGVVELVSYVNPDQITELGSGTGETAMRLADEFSMTEVVGIDNRETVTEISRDNLEGLDFSNLTFETADMREHVQNPLPEMVVMLYSFHHIPDPLQQKIDFLEDCYATLPDRGHICIAETFLKTDARNEIAEREIRTTWADRALEGYASTFWSALNGLDQADIEHAQEVGDFSRNNEREAGENAVDRDEEYMVSMKWLVEHAQSIGFEVILAEPINSLGEAIVLLRK
jgi:ubiquinone/menaquinone biosynthesis C-methylase UbiE